VLVRKQHVVRDRHALGGGLNVVTDQQRDDVVVSHGVRMSLNREPVKESQARYPTLNHGLASNGRSFRRADNAGALTPGC
jgi:hypothetical protein